MPAPPDPDDPVDLADSILERVRRACAAVAAESTLVRIDHDRLAGYASTLAGPPVGSASPSPGDPPADPWSVPASTDEATVGLVLALAAVNFGSGYHPHVRKRPGCSGAVTMASALRDWAAAEPVTPDRLAGLAGSDTFTIFGQPDDGGPVTELMVLFGRALQDLGQRVIEDHDGSFVALVDAARGSAASLVMLLDGLRLFHDVADHHGREVPLYKRAQLAAADLDRVLPAGFDGSGPIFGDLDRLTAFADNLVPHVLRVDGVLRYDPTLAATIDAGEPLPRDSEGEVEIRAVGVHAVELLRAELAAREVEVTSSRLDARLWQRGAGPRYKAIPRHRTRSTAY